MIKKYESLLEDLNLHTELLESVGWCEESLQSMMSSLQEKMSDKDETSHTILSSIKEDYGENAYKTLKELFNKIYIENGLYNTIGNSNEH